MRVPFTLFSPKIILGVLLSAIIWYAIYSYIDLYLFKKETKIEESSIKVFSAISKDKSISISREVKNGKIHVDPNCTACFYKLHTR